MRGMNIMSKGSKIYEMTWIQRKCTSIKSKHIRVSTIFIDHMSIMVMILYFVYSDASDAPNATLDDTQTVDPMDSGFWNCANADFFRAHTDLRL